MKAMVMAPPWFLVKGEKPRGEEVSFSLQLVFISFSRNDKNVLRNNRFQ